MSDSHSRRGRRKDSRGRYLIHVLECTNDAMRSACGSLAPGPPDSFSDQQPDHNHPLCQPCLHASSRPSSVRPVVVRAAIPQPAPAAPAGLSLEMRHRMVWAAHALGSANRLAIVEALRTGPTKMDALRESVGQWEGMFDLSMDALTRGRVVEVAGKRVGLTSQGRALYEFLAKCAAGMPSDPAAPTHLY